MGGVGEAQLSSQHVVRASDLTTFACIRPYMLTPANSLPHAFNFQYIVWHDELTLESKNAPNQHNVPP